MKGGWGELGVPQKPKWTKTFLALHRFLIYTPQKNYLKRLVWEDCRGGACKPIIYIQVLIKGVGVKLGAIKKENTDIF